MNHPLVVAGLIAAAVLVVGGAATRIGPWFHELRKPRWNPPNWLFPPMWTLIGACCAWAGATAWTAAPEAHWRIAILFGLNSLFNVVWSPLFFTLQRPDWALMEVPLLWLSVVALVVGLAPLSAFAGWLLVPYLVWVTIAAALNLAIVRLNAPFNTGARAT